MKRSLRKGGTSIEYHHKYGWDSVRVINTEIELKQDHAVFRTTLKPAGSNQKMDADKVFPENINTLSEIKFDDLQVSKVLKKFLSAYEERINYVALEIDYKKVYQLNAEIGAVGDNGISFKIKT